MKFFLIVVILASFQAQLSVAQGDSIRDIINAFLDRIRDLIQDPIEFSESAVVIPDNDFITGSLNITEGYLSGLRGMSIDVQYRGIIIPIPIGFTITTPRTEFNQRVLSDLQITNLSVDISRDFRLNIVTNDFVIEGDLDFTILPLNLTVTAVRYTVGDIQVTVEGLISERFSEILSESLTRIAGPLLNALQEPISAIIQDIINNIISGIFSNMYMENPEMETLEISHESSIKQLRLFFETLERSLILQEYEEFEEYEEYEYYE